MNQPQPDPLNVNPCVTMWLRVLNKHSAPIRNLAILAGRACVLDYLNAIIPLITTLCGCLCHLSYVLRFNRDIVHLQDTHVY